MRRGILIVWLAILAGPVWAESFVPAVLVGAYYKGMDVEVTLDGVGQGGGPSATFPGLSAWVWTEENYFKAEWDVLSLSRTASGSGSWFLAEDNLASYFPQLTFGALWTDLGWLGVGVGAEFGSSRLFSVSGGRAGSVRSATNDGGLNLTAVYNASEDDEQTLLAAISFSGGLSLYPESPGLTDGTFGSGDLTLVANSPLIGAYASLGFEYHRLPGAWSSGVTRVLETLSRYVRVGISPSFLFTGE